MLGGIEAGGTKFICAVGTGPEDLVKAQFPTTMPEHTLAQVISFFQSNGAGGLEAIGIGSFGPVDLDTASPTYGYITNTPKAGWSNFDLLGSVSKALGVPIGFDTDVNAALLGEWRWGAAQNLANAVYLTFGTGVGGGVMVHGQVVHGLVHPEIGHLRIPHDLSADPFRGSCPFHKDCLEGLASGPAIEKRWGRITARGNSKPAT
jgi:fructokinase